MPEVVRVWDSTMNSRTRALRVLALGSSLALLAGYVWISKRNAERNQPASGDESVGASLPGSKSKVMSGDLIPLSEPADPGTADRLVPEESDEPKGRAVLPGSKSFSPILGIPESDPPESVPAVEPGATESKQPEP